MIVYISEPLSIPTKMFETVPPVLGQIANNFTYPTTLRIEDNNKFLVGAHLNGRCSVVLRISGMKELLTMVK
jgi:hypothetical protein